MQLQRLIKNLIGLDERIENARAPVYSVLVNLFRLRMAFSVETVKNFDSVRQSGSSRCYDSRLQAVAYSTFASIPTDILKFSNRYNYYKTCYKRII